MFRNESTGGFPKALWRTHRRNLLNMHIPKELSKSIGEIAMSDKKDEFKQERTPRRVDKIRMSNTYLRLPMS